MQDVMRQFKAGVFQALAHPTRVAIVECLGQGELSVNQLGEKLGIEQANTSQHLSILRNKQIVQTRKAGNQTFYRLRDPAFSKVLAALKEHFLAHLAKTLQMLREEQAEPETPPPKNRRRVRR